MDTLTQALQPLHAKEEQKAASQAGAGTGQRLVPGPGKRLRPLSSSRQAGRKSGESSLLSRRPLTVA